VGRIAVLDSSVLIAFLDPEDTDHESAVSVVSRGGEELVVPSTVYAEVLVRPDRISEGEAARIRRFFDEVPIRVQAVDRELAGTAARLRARVGFRLPDAMVIATAESLGAETVFTADRRWRGKDHRVKLI
jgi:predicted nucleic acid-binding protein